jgi:lipopolysaccharide transport system permease protein
LMPQIKINSASLAAASLFQTVWQYRRYILSNARQDFLFKYVGTGIGLMWNVIHPIMMVSVFSFVFTVITPTRFRTAGIQDVSFVVFLCSGLLPWLSFLDGLQRTTASLVENAGYLRKLAIPEEVFLAKTIVGSCILLAINLVVLVAAALLLGSPPQWTWVLIPLVGAMMMLFAFGLGAAFGTINVFVRDVAQIITIVTQVWMWLTPIVYSLEAMPAWLRAVQFVNPVFPFIELFRELFLFGRLGAPLLWLAAGAWTTAALFIGSAVLRRFRTELRDVL